MKSFIPNYPNDEPPESDDSGDEIPPGGVLFPAMAIDLDDGDDEDIAENDHDSDSNSDSDNDANDARDDEGMSEEDIDVSSESDSDSSSSEAEATIEEIFGVKPNIEANRDHPPDLEVDSGIVDICFHPTHDLIATATMDGEVMIFRYSKEAVEEVTKFSHHQKPCRAVCYNEDGTTLYTVSKDKSLAVLDTQNSAVQFHIKDAHDSPIFSCHPINDFLCSTGDDDGNVKIWDIRDQKPVFNFKCGEETVTSLLSEEAKKNLVASLSDGSIAGFNIRAKRLEAQSELYESELTSMALVRNDSRLVVGSGEGTLFIFRWGEFGFHIDRFAGHRHQIHCIVPITDRMIITGCEDGVIRAVHMYPHRFVGVVGQHKDFGIENLSISHDGTFLASCSMDEVVRFWNIDFLYNTEVDERKKGNKKGDRLFNLESSKKRNRCDFFNDFPEKLDSDDDGGPVAGPSHTTD